MISLLLDETGLEDSLVDNYLRHKRSSEMRHVKKVAYRKEPFTASDFGMEGTRVYNGKVSSEHPVAARVKKLIIFLFGLNLPLNHHHGWH